MVDGRVVLLGRDDRMTEPVRRLCAAAGLSVDVETDLTAARRCWHSELAVVVDAEVADLLATLDLPRRANVVVVTRDPTPVSAWRAAVAIGALNVVDPLDGERWILDWLTRLADGPSVDALTVGCLPGAGGAGASTLAAALAISAAVDGPATLVDADPGGGGVDLLLGAEGLTGLRWPELTGSRGVVAADALRAALPRAGGLSLLSWTAGTELSASAEAMAALVDSVRRSSRTVVIDLPGKLDPAAQLAVASCDVVLLVVPAEVRAAAGAGRAVVEATRLCRDVRLLVRHPGPADLAPRDVSERLGVPLAGVIRSDRRLATMADRGQLHDAVSRTSLGSLASKLLVALHRERKGTAT